MNAKRPPLLVSRHGRLDGFRSFVVLAEELHFGRAAQRLNLSQPALTLRIQALETELGVSLVARGKRHSDLTPAGRAFLREARIALHHVALAASQAKDAAGGSAGRITVGFCYDHQHGLLPRALARFGERYPGVSVETRLDPSPELVRAVSDHRLDIAFVSAPLERESRTLRRLDLPSTRLIALLPAGHRLAGRRRIALSSLARERFVLPPLIGWTGFYRQLASLFEEAGFAPQVAFEALDTTFLANLVAQGAGVGIASLSSVPAQTDGVAYVALEGESAVTALAAIWSAGDESTALSQFLAALVPMAGGRHRR